MAILAVYLIPVVLLVAQARCRSGLAEPVIQQLSERGNYVGGWALSSSQCPAGTTSCGSNLGCCPTSQVCNGPNIAYCCPTSKSQHPFRCRGMRSLDAATDCIETIRNIPVCANPDWTMWSLGANGYFCCESGLVGVLPVSGFAGLCEDADVDIPATQLATSV